jgi:transcriptional/translational regulatory protein YebC/TACO1
VAVVIQAMTDNKNRTVSDLRNIFNKAGGTFGTQVGWQFDHRGILEVTKSGNVEDLELAVIDAGALDFSDAGDFLEVYTEPKALDQVRNKLESAGFKVTSSALGLVPKSKTIITDPNMARRVLNFLDALDDYDDVTEVSSTLDVPDEVMSKLED